MCPYVCLICPICVCARVHLLLQLLDLYVFLHGLSPEATATHHLWMRPACRREALNNNFLFMAFVDNHFFPFLFPWLVLSFYCVLHTTLYYISLTCITSYATCRRYLQRTTTASWPPCLRRALPRTNSFHTQMLNHLTNAIFYMVSSFRVMIVHDRQRMSRPTESALHTSGSRRCPGLISSGHVLGSGYDVPMRPDDLDDYCATRW